MDMMKKRQDGSLEGREDEEEEEEQRRKYLGL